jgi:predicted component of type VI protein secretion system
MADETAQVHWHEGLFLQPHHLQVMQRRFMESLAGLHLLSASYPAGIIKAAFSLDALAKGDLRFTELRAMMPSGLEVDFPENASLEERKIDVRSFPGGGGPLIVRLAVPRWGEMRANSIELGESVAGGRRLYRVIEKNFPDENNASNLQMVRLRRVNARLLFGNEDDTDMETLPLLRIKNPTVTGSVSPVMDDTFWPPCLDVKAWPPLSTLIANLVDRIEEVRKRIASEMVRGSFQVDTLKPTQMKSLLRLGTLGRFSAKL